MQLLSPEYGCQLEKNTNQTIDPRFKEIDFSISEYYLQSQSGVADILKNVKDIDLFYLTRTNKPMNIKKNYKYELMTREALFFSRTCDLYGNFTRQ
jgi:hypothetical protein